MKLSGAMSIAACCGLMTLGPQPAIADTATLFPVRDNTLVESATGSLSNGAGMYLFAGRTGQVNDSVRRCLIAFDVTGIPSRSMVTGVVLTLHISRAAAAGTHDVQLHRVLATWGEGTSVGGSGEGAGATATPGDATWIHASFGSQQWANPGGDFAPTTSATASAGSSGAVTWGSTTQMVADVQGWVDVPGSAQGWILIGNEAVARSAKRFVSRQNAIVSMRPSLTVTFDPPTAIEAGTWSRVKELYR